MVDRRYIFLFSNILRLNKMPKRKECIWLTTAYKEKLRHINVVCLLHINYSNAITRYPWTVKCDLSQRAGKMTCVFCRWVRFRTVTYKGIILKHVYCFKMCIVLIFNHVNLSYKREKMTQMSVYMRLCYGLRLVFCLWGDDLMSQLTCLAYMPPLHERRRSLPCRFNLKPSFWGNPAKKTVLLNSACLVWLTRVYSLEVDVLL